MKRENIGGLKKPAFYDYGSPQYHEEKGYNAAIDAVLAQIDGEETQDTLSQNQIIALIPHNRNQDEEPEGTTWKNLKNQYNAGFNTALFYMRDRVRRHFSGDKFIINQAALTIPQIDGTDINGELLDALQLMTRTDLSDLGQRTLALQNAHTALANAENAAKDKTHG